MGKHNDYSDSNGGSSASGSGDETDEMRWRSKFKFRIVLHDCVLYRGTPMQWSRMSLRWRPKQQLRLKKFDDTDAKMAKMPKWIGGKCPWPGCGKELKGHDKHAHWRVHTGERPFPCRWPDCGKQFRQDTALKSHMEKHTEQSTLKCSKPSCGLWFTTEQALQTHTRRHDGLPGYACDHPGCLFSTDFHNWLVDHKRDHTSDAAVSCGHPGCEYRSVRPRRLLRHRKGHTDGKLACDYPGCSFRCKKPSRLRTHQQRHTEEKLFACTKPGCDFKTKTKRDVEKHEKRHDAIKNLECTFPGCAYRTAERYHLTSHMKRHAGLRPFTCSEGCEQKFDTKQHMHRHVVSMHTKEGQLRKKRDEERFFKTLREDHKIVVDGDQREFHIDMSCLGETFARLDGVHYAKDFVGVLECNEWQHKHYPSVSCDVSRALKIRAALTASGDERPLAIYNFNPHSYTVDDEKQTMPYKDRIACLAKWLTDEKYKPTKPLSLFYFYYDMETMENTNTGEEWVQPCLFSDSEYPREVREFVRCVW